MDLEIKPVYNDFYNKLLENSSESPTYNKSKSSSELSSSTKPKTFEKKSQSLIKFKSKVSESDSKSKTLSKLESNSEEEAKVFAEFHKIIKSNDPKKYKLSENKLVSPVGTTSLTPTAQLVRPVGTTLLTPTTQLVSPVGTTSLTQKKQSNNITSTKNLKKELVNINKKQEKSKSDNYTKSSGLGEDNMVLRDMFIKNIQKMNTTNNNNQQTNNPVNNMNLLIESKKMDLNNNYSDSDEQLLEGNNKKKDKKEQKNKKESKKIIKKNNLDSNSLINTESESNKDNIKLNFNKVEDFTDNNNNNIIYEDIKEDSSINSEFKQFFAKDRKKKITKNTDNQDPKQKQLNQIEQYYDKYLHAQTKKKERLDEIKKTANKVKEEINENEYKKKDLVKILLKKLEKNVFVESTRGFNLDSNIYKLNMQKLKANLLNFELPKDSKCTVGYLYRNFNNPKVYNSTSQDTHWLEVSKAANSISILENELESKNKFLQACLKNFAKSKKFKKQVGSSLFRARINTVELLNTNNLVVDIIFFVKYRNQ